jgi:phosphonate transport system substrate-binding protein
MQEPKYFAVCPHDTAAGVERWAMFHAVVAKRVSPGSRYVPYFNFKEFDQALRDGKLRWGYLNPAQFLLVRKMFGFVPLARPVERPDQVVIVQSVASPAASLAELAGKRIAAAPGYLFALAKHELALRGIPFSVVQVRGYTEVMRAISQGEADAGISYNEHWGALTDYVREQFAVVDRISPGLSHVVAAHPDVPVETREALRQFLLGSHHAEDTARALGKVGMKAFEEFDAKPFDALEGIVGG